MTPTPSETDEALATALAQDAVNAMWSRDQAAQALGMEIRQVLAGSATLRMRVRKDMVNGHQICHG